MSTGPAGATPALRKHAHLCPPHKCRLGTSLWLTGVTPAPPRMCNTYPPPSCAKPQVSYEYVACQSDNAGVLVLSEFAGAAQSLGAGAILVNPWNITDMAQAR
eukprot:358696-Chlamydomonas_euryale.AAC.8